MSDTAPNSFAQLLTHWQGFFSMAGTAAATLVGLLFVAVSLHLDLFSDDRERQTRISAQQTLTNFFNVLVLALLFNIPDWTTSLIGKGTMFVGGVSFFRAIWMLIKHAHGGWSKLLGLPLVSRSYLTFLLRQVLFPIAAYGFITVAGAMLNDGNTDALNLLAGLIIAVLVGAGWSAWNLMINLSRYRTRRNSAQNQANSVAKPNITP